MRKLVVRVANKVSKSPEWSYYFVLPCAWTIYAGWILTLRFPRFKLIYLHASIYVSPPQRMTEFSRYSTKTYILEQIEIFAAVLTFSVYFIWNSLSMAMRTSFFFYFSFIFLVSTHYVTVKCHTWQLILHISAKWRKLYFI